jgi:hypothetical protein
MDEQEIQKRLIEHVDPNRRSFVRRILAGAALVSPLIATFSIDTLTAGTPEDTVNPNSTCTEDQGYIGPNAFQAHISDPTGGTRANGMGMFTITVPLTESATVAHAKLRFTLTVTKNNGLNGAYIEAHGRKLIDLPDGNGYVDNAPNRNLCDFDELLECLANGDAVLVVGVDIQHEMYTLKGPIVPAQGSQTISLNP